jgi:hypothetical protein
MLGRKLNRVQWLSLFFLGLGVATIQLSTKASGTTVAKKAAELMARNQLIGLASVVLSCFCSAIAATYFELVLKRTQIPTHQDSFKDVPRNHRRGWSEAIGWTKRPKHAHASRHSVTCEIQPPLPPPSAPRANLSVWVRNVQLSFFSCILGLFVVVGETASRDSAAFSTWASSLNDNINLVTLYQPVRLVFGSFLEGFNALTWLVIFIQAIGGLLTALVVRCDFSCIRCV